jgi:GntR family transcriptional regulator, transcriptional repressor for pyruvate dehydrogenase complex
MSTPPKKDPKTDATDIAAEKVVKSRRQLNPGNPMGDGAMKDAFAPVLKHSLSDRLARRIRSLIQKGDYSQGDRLPSIMEMASRFGVGHPTIREALKKLETMGIVEIRHGSGVYVSRSDDVLVLASPDYGGEVTKKLLIDLISTRMPLEMQSAADAVRNGTPEHLLEMRRLLTTAAQNLDNDDTLNSVNMAFHRQIAQASGNAVLAQLIDVLKDLFTSEQRLILGIFGSRERDHQEHLAILAAIEERDETLAVERMRTHLEGVREAVRRWDPEKHPVV